MKGFLLLLSIGLFFYSIAGSDFKKAKAEDAFFLIAKREPTIKEMIDGQFGSQKANAYRVFQCESGLNPKAVSKTQDFGISQVHLPAHRNKIAGKNDWEKIQTLFDYKENIRIAKRIYDASGSFNPWVCAQKLGIK